MLISSSIKQTEEEPKLSYERILNDLPTIVEKDFITTSCLHSKLFVVGTNSGKIHIFDHQGNKVNQEILAHSKAVRSISIDDKGEYILSCCNDRVVVYGLCNTEHNFVIMPDKSPKIVAIDPIFYKSGSGRRFIICDDKVTLYERGFLARYKTSHIQAREDKILDASWNGQFFVWATEREVKIYDNDQRVIITKIKRDTNIHNDTSNTCSFSWKDKQTLMIGWGCSVKICLIKDRPQELLESNLRELPKKYVEIISMFDTDVIIHGLAPFENGLVALSLNNVFESDDLIVKPQVQILEFSPSGYTELSKDSLNPCGVVANINKPEQYALRVLLEESLYFLVCPKDVILAKPRDHDDHLDWLISRGKLKEAYLLARDNSHKLRRYSSREIEEMYMKELRDNIEKLMAQKPDETALLLVENIQSISKDEVIERLKKSPAYLLAYLHQLHKKDSEACIEYHDMMIKLYAKYKKENLMSFLKQSTYYNLEKASKLCQELNLIKEVVFLYGRMGNLKVALEYIMNSQGDLYEAIEFCKEHQDPDLWRDLINYSNERPEYISILLQNIGSYIDDPSDLIKRIPRGVDIEGLIPALVKILQDYQLQISEEQRRNDKATVDCFSQMKKQLKVQARAVEIDPTRSCNVCNQPLSSLSSKSLGDTYQLQDHLSSPTILSPSPSRQKSLIYFRCLHVFHQDCCSNQLGFTSFDTFLDTQSVKCPLCVINSNAM